MRVLRPGKPIPPDVKKHMSRHPEMDTQTCAVVEFEAHDSARKACDDMNDLSDWRTGLCVSLLLNQKKAQKSASAAKQNKASGNDAKPMQAEITSAGGDDPAHASKSPAMTRADKMKEGGKWRDHRGKKKEHHDKEYDPDVGMWRGGSGDTRSFTRDSLSPQSNKFSPGNSPRSSPRGSPHFRRRTASHGKSPLATDQLHSPKISPCPSPETRRKQGASLEATPSPGGSPWVQRRLKAQLEGSASPLAAGSPLGSPRQGRRRLDLEGVLRQPKGPEGAGFYLGRGRGVPVSPLVVEKGVGRQE